MVGKSGILLISQPIISSYVQSTDPMNIYTSATVVCSVLPSSSWIMSHSPLVVLLWTTPFDNRLKSSLTIEKGRHRLHIINYNINKIYALHIG